eukprot:6507614-Lingulodinium_polyedra.AAC.1
MAQAAPAPARPQAQAGKPQGAPAPRPWSSKHACTQDSGEHAHHGPCANSTTASDKCRIQRTTCAIASPWEPCTHH